MKEALEPSTNGSSGHEHREADYKLILYSALGLAVTLVVVFLLMWGTFNVLKNNERAKKGEVVSPLAAPFQLPPEPRLEVTPWESMQELRARENHLLTTYGWQDQKAGIVRIPIERAMDLVVEHGLPLQSQQPVKPVPPGAKNAK